MNFADSSTVVDDVPVLQLRGEIEIRSQDAFRACLQNLLDGAPQAVVIDLSDVSFFDSTGLHVLDEFDARAGKQGTKVALAGLQQRVLRLFEITGLDLRFSIFASADLAAASASSG